MKLGKTEINAMATVLDQDHPSMEDAAAAALAEAEQIFQSRASFVVVGQLAGTSESGDVAPSDPAAIKVALGWYSTEGDARSAAESLWQNTGTGDRFRVWVLDVHHGTPAELHSKQKAKYADLQAKRDQAQQERLKLSIEKRLIEDEKEAKGCKTCTHPSWEHSPRSPRGECKLDHCDCKLWVEQ